MLKNVIIFLYLNAICSYT